MKKVAIRYIRRYMEEHGWKCRYELTQEDNFVFGFSSLKHYKHGTVTWVKNQEKAEGKDLSKVTLLVAQEGCRIEAANVIYSAESKKVFFALVDEVLDPRKRDVGIGLNTVIGSDVELGDNVSIGANCSITGEIRIGSHSTIGDNVVLCNRVSIGEHTEIQPGCVIGIDGFGFYEDKDHRNKTMVRHHGGVVIGSYVFIGSHTNIARGTLDDTVIEDDVKIAPSTHIGHNNHIGGSATVICSKLYGSVALGENAYVTACTVENQCHVGRDALVGMGAVVTKDVPDNQVVVGIPAKRLKERY